MPNVPIKHHYVPQFMLKNFCFKDKLFYYYDKAKNITSVKRTDEIFLTRNLYRDEINHSDNPTEIETKMSKFENEIAKLINDKFLNDSEIIISKEEEEKLRLFISVMSLRNNRTAKQFSGNMSDAAKDFYTMFQVNGDFNDLWKRNLSLILDCRSIPEVGKHDKIDLPFKYFMLRDGFMNYEGVEADLLKELLKNPLNMLPFMLYFVVVERRGQKDFVIGDNYPPLINGTLDSGKEQHLYTLCPISSERMILLVSLGAIHAPKDVKFLSDVTLKQPNFDAADRMHISVKKVYQKEVEILNKAIMDVAVNGYAFIDKERI